MKLSNKIDFAIIFSVKNANPNGDPLNGNRPRTDYEGYGEITDVCLKRKIRDRLQEQGHSIFVQSDEKKTDGMTSLQNRAYSDKYGLGEDAFDSKKTLPDKTIEKACEKWFDVRAFGQLFAFGGKEKKAGSGVSIPIRGPVSIQSAFSVEPVSVTSIQITKSVDGQPPKSGKERSSDRMGMKHRIDDAVYVAYGAMNPQLAERTGFSDEDAKKIKDVLPRLFEGDASSARPEGSMVVNKVIWWQHNCPLGQYSSAKVHGTLKVEPDGSYRPLSPLDGLTPEQINGF